METTFKLPIEYLDTKFVHKLSDVVINDLELVDSSTETLPSMYDVLLTPKHEFAKNMIQKWKTHFTSDVEFIQQSQEVIKNTNCTNCTNTKPNTFELQNIWKDIYETPNFHDRYSYIDIQQFHFVNNI